jgi:FkbM family methyltransferase
VKGKWTRLGANLLGSAEIDNTVLSAIPPLCAISRRGRLIYVDRDDLRGAALVISQGEAYPIASRIWRHLLQSQSWSHIIDVGANYGEMIIDLEINEDMQVLAVEPNPYVRCNLERSIGEAGLPIKVIPYAITDKVDSIEFNLDRTWSGMSSIRFYPRDMVGHLIEKIQVQATTLASLLEGGATSSEKRVLIKIDVEGNELDVLRGLGGVEKTFADFAALVEIRHLSESDFAALMDSYTVELFDGDNDTLVTVPDASPGQLLAFVHNSGLYSHDAVLRPRMRAGPAQNNGGANH